MSYAAVEMKTIQWGEARGIVQNSTPYAQALKTKEELEELFEAISKGDREAMADAYGDILVTLVMESEWEGHVTLEFSNTTTLPAKIYANEGACQFIFLKGDQEPETSYADKKGKYMKQKGVTLPKI